MLDITVVQPKYYSGENPDEKIAKFLLSYLDNVCVNSLIVFPEYSNAGGLSDAESELLALDRAEYMLSIAEKVACEKKAYVSINVLQRRQGKIKNSTYLFDKNGNSAFVYDKIHLPPSEIKLGVEAGNGECTCEVDGIKFAFMTCYDVYFNEQIEDIAKFKPDIVLVPGYQRGERVDIIRAQAKLLAFRCNSFVARSSYSMDTDKNGGCSMIVAPDGEILNDMGKDVGSITVSVDVFQKYMRSAGFGEKLVRNDDFISAGLRHDIYGK